MLSLATGVVSVSLTVALRTFEPDRNEIQSLYETHDVRIYNALASGTLAAPVERSHLKVELRAAAVALI